MNRLTPEREGVIRDWCSPESPAGTISSKVSWMGFTKELLAEIDSLRAEVTRLHDKYDFQLIVRERATLRAALEQIAVGPRPDGTFNRCREACMELAREALKVEPEKKS